MRKSSTTRLLAPACRAMYKPPPTHSCNQHTQRRKLKTIRRLPMSSVTVIDMGHRRDCQVRNNINYGSIKNKPQKTQSPTTINLRDTCCSALVPRNLIWSERLCMLLFFSSIAACLTFMFQVVKPEPYNYARWAWISSAGQTVM